MTDAMSKMAFQLSQITADRKERRVRFGSEDKVISKKLCIYCDKEDCWKAKCPELKSAIQQGAVALDETGLIVDATGNHLKANYGKGGMKAFVKQKPLGTYHVQITENGPKMPSTEIYDKIHIDLVNYADVPLAPDVVSALNNMWNEGLEKEAEVIYDVLMKRKPDDEPSTFPKKFRPWETPSETLSADKDMQTDKRK